MRVEFRYGKKTRELREERLWTQEHLAEVAGVDTRAIQRVERDRTNRGRGRTLPLNDIAERTLKEALAVAEK